MYLPYLLVCQRRELPSLLLCLCDVFPMLINSLICGPPAGRECVKEQLHEEVRSSLRSSLATVEAGKVRNVSSTRHYTMTPCFLLCATPNISLRFFVFLGGWSLGRGGWGWLGVECLTKRLTGNSFVSVWAYLHQCNHT